MFSLFTIICAAVVVLMATKTERGRPVGLMAIGILSLVLGGSAVAMVSDSFSSSLVNAVAAQEVSSNESKSGADIQPGDEETQAGPSPEQAEPRKGSSESEAADGDDAVSQPEDAAESDEETGIGEEIEPVARVKFLTERPEWVDSKPDLNSDVHKFPVASGYEVRKHSADRELVKELDKQIDEYINDYLESEYAATLLGHRIQETEEGDDRVFRLGLNDRSFEIARDPFEELVEFDFGVMNQSHVLVSLDEEVREELDDRWKEIRATSRLLQAGVGAGAVLLLLGTMFSYFKLDTATRGYYAGRLQFAAAAAILVVVAVCVLLAKSIHWM